MLLLLLLLLFLLLFFLLFLFLTLLLSSSFSSLSTPTTTTTTIATSSQSIFVSFLSHIVISVRPHPHFLSLRVFPSSSTFLDMLSDSPKYSFLSVSFLSSCLFTLPAFRLLSTYKYPLPFQFQEDKKNTLDK